MDEFWQIVTAVGVVVTAVIGWLTYQSMTRFNLPNLTLEKSRSVSGVCGFKFKADVEPGRPRWLVVGVKLRVRWHRSYLAKTGEQVPKAGRGLIPFEPGSWQRRIHFDPPVAEGSVFLHSDSPDPVDIRFYLLAELLAKILQDRRDEVQPARLKQERNGGRQKTERDHDLTDIRDAHAPPPRQHSLPYPLLVWKLVSFIFFLAFHMIQAFDDALLRVKLILFFLWSEISLFIHAPFNQAHIFLFPKK